MTWVKICGITNLEDAQIAVEAGADALGFIFYEKSPRNVHPQIVQEIVAQVPASIEKVGVFVGNSVSRRVVHQARLTAVQLHIQNSRPSRQTLNELSLISKTIFIALSSGWLMNSRVGGFRWRTEAKDKVTAFFLDSGTVEKPGGTGQTFDWVKVATVLPTLDENFRFVVAGGLTPANVAEAMRILKPWGVDVSSGVEVQPGKKDPEKVRAFVAAVRQAENG